MGAVICVSPSRHYITTSYEYQFHLFERNDFLSNIKKYIILMRYSWLRVAVLLAFFLIWQKSRDKFERTRKYLYNEQFVYEREFERREIRLRV